MDKDEFYAEARSGWDGPLAGLRVLDLTTAWAGPMATVMLADLGARVVRVELPGNTEGQMPPYLPGTGLSWFRESVHRNKRSLGLDIRVPQGRDVLLELAGRADVLVESFRPGTMAGWGLGYADLRAVKPDLVYVSISGYGQFGPRSPLPAYDPAVQALGGWMSLNGSADGPPVKAPTFLSDDLAGLHGALGALAALRHRDRTGEGQHVDVALLDALLYQSSGILALAAAGVPLPRMGDQTSFLVPCGVYACDGGHLYLVVALDKQWRAVATTLGRPELATARGWGTNAERLRNRDAVNALVAGWCAGRPLAEAVGALQDQGAIVAPVRSFAEAAADDHVRERDMLVDVRLRDGSVAALTGPAVKFSRTPATVRGAAPAPGSDTEELLGELGLDGEALDRLRAAGAI
jgi:formyl-CoA transferase